MTYNYDVSTPGTEELVDVTVTDDKCSPLSFVRGDTDGDNRLDPGEVWRYTCTGVLTTTTTNVGTVTARDDDGNLATDDDTVTVQVTPVAARVSPPEVLGVVLARTGSDSDRGFLIGVGLLLIGVGFVLMGDERRRRPLW